MMNYKIVQIKNERGQKAKIVAFLNSVNREFAVPLTQKVDLESYAEKLLNNGYIFAAIVDDSIKGIICGYANDMANRRAYASSFVVAPDLRGSGAALELYKNQIRYCCTQGMKELNFTTNKKNAAAIRFYQKMRAAVIEKQCTNTEIAYRVIL